MDDLEDIDLVCVPDAMLPYFQSNGEAINVQSSTLEHCLRMGDRFAILDGFPRSHKPELASVDVDNKAVHPAVAHWQNLPPEHGALYYPWVSVRKLSSSGKTGSSLSEMPCDRYARLNHGDSGAGSARGPSQPASCLRAGTLQAFTREAMQGSVFTKRRQTSWWKTSSSWKSTSRMMS